MANALDLHSGRLGSSPTVSTIKFNSMNKIRVTENREKALELVNAYFDGKEIEVCDPLRGVSTWMSIDNMSIWTFLEMFCKNTDKYRIVE